MPISISYMGTKRQLSEKVAALTSECQRGIFLDIFSGMCSVAKSVSPTRQIWTNDLQCFSYKVGSSFFCSTECLPDAFNVADLLYGKYNEHREHLRDLYCNSIKIDDDAILKESIELLEYLFDDGIKSSHMRSFYRGNYDLFCIRYSGSYFSFRQTIEIDSIRYSIDQNLYLEKISQDQHRWLIIGLCIAMSKCSTTTGHFAQPMRPKSQNIKKYISQRKRSVWSEFINNIGTLVPVGTNKWRSENMSFHKESSILLDEIKSYKIKPKVIYADPPYTKDQYSRYYHIYETAVLYDYPLSLGTGLYRPDRPVSDFSLSSRVDNAISNLVAQSAELGSDLILSYPTNGLLPESQHRIPKIIKEHYKKRPEVFQIPYIHSTMGGSSGTVSNPVTEVVYRVRKL